MGFLTELHTFGAWAEKELAAIVGKAPKIEAVAASVLQYAGPALQTVVSIEAGAPAGALVGKIIAEAQGGLVAASGLLSDFGATPTVGSVVSSVKTNLSALLSASNVTNPTSVATITKVINELDLLATALSGTPAVAAVPPTTTA
jgi:hypothetical protein